MTQKLRRKPKHMGTGIYVHQQPFLEPDKCVKGDTFNDADYGDMVFDGKKWISEYDWDEKQWMAIGRKYFRYAATCALYKKKPMALLEFLKEYYHHPKRNHRK